MDKDDHVPNALEKLTHWLCVVLLTFTTSFTVYFFLLVFPTDAILSLLSFCLCRRKKKQRQEVAAVGSNGEPIMAAASSVVSSQATRLAVSKFIRE